MQGSQEAAGSLRAGLQRARLSQSLHVPQRDAGAPELVSPCHWTTPATPGPVPMGPHQGRNSLGPPVCCGRSSSSLCQRVLLPSTRYVPSASPLLPTQTDTTLFTCPAPLWLCPCPCSAPPAGETASPGLSTCFGHSVPQRSRPVQERPCSCMRPCPLLCAHPCPGACPVCPCHECLGGSCESRLPQVDPVHLPEPLVWSSLAAPRPAVVHCEDLTQPASLPVDYLPWPGQPPAPR